MPSTALKCLRFENSPLLAGKHTERSSISISGRMSACRATSSVVLAASTNMDGWLDISILVHSACGVFRICRFSPVSTIRPFRITAIRSRVWATTPRSCVTRMMESPRLSRRSSRRWRICAWIVTSSAVVGSSAIEEMILPYVADGRLVRVLQKYSPPWDGYYLYYPSRRQASPAFVRVLEALRYRV